MNPSFKLKPLLFFFLFAPQVISERCRSAPHCPPSSTGLFLSDSVLAGSTSVSFTPSRPSFLSSPLPLSYLTCSLSQSVTACCVSRLFQEPNDPQDWSRHSHSLFLNVFPSTFARYYSHFFILIAPTNIFSLPP